MPCRARDETALAPRRTRLAAREGGIVGTAGATSNTVTRAGCDVTETRTGSPDAAPQTDCGAGTTARPGAVSCLQLLKYAKVVDFVLTTLAAGRDIKPATLRVIFKLADLPVDDAYPG